MGLERKERNAALCLEMKVVLSPKWYCSSYKCLLHPPVDSVLTGAARVGFVPRDDFSKTCYYPLYIYIELHGKFCKWGQQGSTRVWPSPCWALTFHPDCCNGRLSKPQQHNGLFLTFVSSFSFGWLPEKNLVCTWVETTIDLLHLLSSEGLLKHHVNLLPKSL